MTTEELRRLKERVERLEQELETLRDSAVEPIPPPPPPPDTAPPAPPYVAGQRPAPPSPPQASVPPPPPPPERPVAAPVRTEDEARVVGTWMARIGAVALVIGAAFAFKYAIDSGLIGPGARVIIGILTGIALAAAGDWARKRTWHGWAQAVTGGAVGLWYLSVWAAYQLYMLIPPTAALAAFTAITVTGVFLALRHASEPLAVLAVVSSFLNPFLIGVLDPAPVFGYVLMIDLGVVALATIRRWRSLDRVALLLTWAAYSAVPAAGDVVAITFGTLVFVLFLLASTRGVFQRHEVDDPEDAVFMVANSIAYAAFALLRLDSEVLQGTFCTVAGLAHLGLAFFARRQQATAAFPSALASMGISLLALAVPLLFDGPAIPAVWTIQGLALLAVGRAFSSPKIAYGGMAFVGLAILETLTLELSFGSDYQPDRLFLNGTSAVLALEVAALAVGSRLVGAMEATSHLRKPMTLGAHALAILWLTLEVRAAVAPSMAPFFDFAAREEVERNLAFATTAVWATYGAGALTAGVIFASRLSRYVGVGLLGFVVLKLVTIDLWMLDTLQRTVAFIGLGAMFLGLSFLYHRFRELVMEGRLR